MSELVNAFCVFQKAGGTKRGSYYYTVIGAFQDEHKIITHLAFEVKFDPTKDDLKFESLELDYNNAQRTSTGYKFIVNPLSDLQQKQVNRAIIGWLSNPSNKLKPCKDKVTGEEKPNFHYKSLGMGKFFINPYGEAMDKLAWEIFCQNIGSEKVRCIMKQKQMMP